MKTNKFVVSRVLELVFIYQVKDFCIFSLLR